MLEIVNQLDGFENRGNIKVLMATNRPDTLDPALMRPGRLDRKVEFGLPDLEGRTAIFKIHARTMSMEKSIRFELLARLCPNTTGAELRSVCTEAGIIYLLFFQVCLLLELVERQLVKRTFLIPLKRLSKAIVSSLPLKNIWSTIDD